MRLSAAAGLVLGCLLLVAVPLLAQLDAVYAQPDAAYTQPQQPQDGHLRLSGVRPAQLGQGLQGQTATYVGLGAAAEAALGDAEQVAEALLAADDATTATRKSIASLQSGGRKHRRVRHGKHSHKHKKDDKLAYEQKEQLITTSDDVQYDIPSEDQHQQLKWGSDENTSYKGPSGHYSKSADDDDTSDGGGGRKRYKKQHRGGSSGSGGGSDDWFGAGGGGASSGKDGPYDADSILDGSSHYYKKGGSGGGAGGDSTYGSGAGGDSYPGSYTPLPSSNKNICKQVLLEEEEVEVVFTPNKDKATITTLLGTCANPNHPLPTLGGGCVVECQHMEDLCNITPLNSHVFLAPANFKSIDNYYPVMCSYRADGPLKGSCNIVMKVACCSDVPKSTDTDDADKAVKAAALKASPMHKAPGKPASSAYSGDDDEDGEEEEGEYYAVVKSKLLRIPLAGHNKGY